MVLDYKSNLNNIRYAKFDMKFFLYSNFVINALRNFKQDYVTKKDSSQPILTF